jgi:hypothetical protein
MPNGRETKTFDLTLLSKTPYLPPKELTSGPDHDLVRLVFDRLCHPVRRTPSGLALEDHFYLVEATTAFADIWQITRIELVNDWRAQATLAKVAHLQDNVLRPIPDSAVRANLLRSMGLQAIAAASLKRP